jgi:RNA polymerase sigma factor (sigma-70 family)
MAIGAAAFASRDIRRLFDEGTAAGVGDVQLLERFAASGDGSAFAALVARHGPMVLGVCRNVLRDPHDAEDAFQATFLVLVRKAGSLGRVRTLGGWLYRVAYRVALEANGRSARRRRREVGVVEMNAAVDRHREPDGELGRVIHEELHRLPEKYREAVVLCDLEGMTREQAAAQLRWPVGTVSGRLARAREILRGRLTRRGIALSTGVIGSLLAERATAAVPPAWAEATIDAATGAGAVPAGASALAVGVVRRMMMARVTWTAAGLLAFGATMGTVLAVADDVMKGKPQAPPTTAKPAAGREAGPNEGLVEVRGRVVDPGGAPFAGARIYLAPGMPIDKAPAPPALRATTGPDGAFRFRVEKDILAGSGAIAAVAAGFAPGWTRPDAAGGELTLARDDVPLTGRVIDLQGRGVPGVEVNLVGLFVPPRGDLVAWLKEGSTKQTGEFWTEAHRLGLHLGGPGVLPSAKTGPDGRFRLTGIGRDRVAVMELKGESVAADFVVGVTRSDQDGPPLSLPAEEGFDGKLRGPDVTVTAAPTRPIVGVVRDRDTGRPIRGVKLTANPYIEAVTDEAGRYRLAGLPKSSRLGGSIATETPDQPYLKTVREVGDAPGLGPMTLDIALKRGAWVEGRVTDAATGRPVAGATLEYFPNRDNPAVAEAADFAGLNNNVSDEAQFTTDAEGRYRAVALPGRGLLAVRAKGYRTAPPLDPVVAGNVLYPGSFQFQMGGYQGLVPIEVPAGAESIRHDIVLTPGKLIRGAVAGPEGKPVVGAKVYGLDGPSFFVDPLKSAEFTYNHPNPGQVETLTFIDERTGLGGAIDIKGDEEGPLHVALKPTGTVSGRVVDADGQPRRGIELQVLFLRKVRGEEIGGTHLVGHVRTDDEGRFRLGLLVPGVRYEISVGKDFAFGGYLDRTWWTIGPGESQDWGDVRVKKIGGQ